MQQSGDQRWMVEAMKAARAGAAEGGIPIGAALVLDGKLVATGNNRRVQESNPILHGETHCLQQAGRLTAKQYQRATLFTTLSPCAMCSGTILLYGIPRVVMAENETFQGEEELLRSRGVEVVNLDQEEAKQMMRDFITAQPTLWNEDIGEPDSDGEPTDPVAVSSGWGLSALCGKCDEAVGPGSESFGYYPFPSGAR